MIKYLPAPDIEEKARRIAELTGIKHDFSRIHFVRSSGSQSKRTTARCHAPHTAVSSGHEGPVHRRGHIGKI